MTAKAARTGGPESIARNLVPPAPAAGAMTAAPINCLLIEDSQFDRQRVRRISEQGTLDVSFTEAPSLDEALKSLRVRDFDVILLDQKLPDGDGTAAAELLRKHLGPEAPPIIMISGSEETAMPVRAFAAGCADYISKDNLTIPGLEKAISGTLAKVKAASAIPAKQVAGANAQLQSFADDMVMELRIPLSRMLRLISRATDRHPAAAAELGDLKAVCREMWDYLDSVRQTAAGKS
jgi:CheY-like chemotaxis protein